MTRDRTHLRQLAEPGQRFGAWTLVRYVGQTARGQRWLCRCDCGSEREHDLAGLRQRSERNEASGCRFCAAKARVHSGLTRRASLRGLTSRFGDREAFLRHDLAQTAIEDEGDELEFEVRAAKQRRRGGVDG